MRMFIIRTVSALILSLCGAANAAEPATVPPAQGDSVYIASDMHGAVVDSATGNPIEGAVVLAYWNLHDKDGGLCGNAENLQEAVSDKDGNYRIPGFNVRAVCDGFNSSDPSLYVFKPGYAFQALSNVSHGEPFPGFSVGMKAYSSDWSNWVIVLAKYPQKLGQSDPKPYDAYAGSLTRLNMMLSWIIDANPKQCNWKRMPNMLRATYAQSEAFVDEGVLVGSEAIELYQFDKDEQMQKLTPSCGSPHEYMRGILYSVPPILHPELVDKTGKTACYWPCPVSFRGTILERVKHLKWKDEKGQSQEKDVRYFVLELLSPANVRPAPSQRVTLNTGTFDGVKEIQLAFDPATWKMDTLVNKKVDVGGYLTQQTGDPQFTDVAEVVTKISTENQ